MVLDCVVGAGRSGVVLERVERGVGGDWLWLHGRSAVVLERAEKGEARLRDCVTAGDIESIAMMMGFRTRGSWCSRCGGDGGHRWLACLGWRIGVRPACGDLDCCGSLSIPTMRVWLKEGRFG